MTDSYHFQIEPEPRAMSMSDHIAYIERKDRERLNQLFDSYYARQAKVLNPLTRTAADVARQSIGPFPSGATLKVAGDKIVGRVEARLVTAGGASYVPGMGGSVTVYCVGGGGGGGGSGSPVQRAPLPNSDEWRGIGHKAHDTFGPDFIVTKGEVPTAPLHTSPTTDSAYPAIAGLLRG